jgi:hypothetical protein
VAGGEAHVMLGMVQESRFIFERFRAENFDRFGERHNRDNEKPVLIVVGVLFVR